MVHSVHVTINVLTACVSVTVVQAFSAAEGHGNGASDG